MINKSLNIQFISIKPQSGYLMILVAVFLLILTASSAQFFIRQTDSIRSSGALRDSTESLMLAETAMETVRGRFINTLDSVVESPTDVVDNVAAAALAPNKASPDTTLFSYMYYVASSSTSGIDQATPSILQRIASGEAVADSVSVLTTRHILTGATLMRISDLFASPGGTTIAPFLFKLNATTGLLEASVAANWNAETGAEKAAAWIEALENPADSTAVDLFVEALAQVGNSKSYVQRYIGTYSNILGGLSILGEARNFNPNP